MLFLRPHRLLPVSALALLFVIAITGCERLDAPKREHETKERLRALVVATAIYMSDFDDTLPPATTTAEMKLYLRPYLLPPSGFTGNDAQRVKDQFFVAPLSGKDFVFNSSLAGTKPDIEKMSGGKSKLANPKVLFYEPTAEWKNKTRFVGMQDGRVESVPESTWNSVTKKQNGIP